MTTPLSAGRGPSSGYGYYTETTSTFPTTLLANKMHYQLEYGPDQRFTSYSPSMMYKYQSAGTSKRSL
jgi:hypothetical protein